MSSGNTVGPETYDLFLVAGVFAWATSCFSSVHISVVFCVGSSKSPGGLKPLGPGSFWLRDFLTVRSRKRVL